MPKQNKKKSKQEDDDDFYDMLADFRAADLTTASSAMTFSAASSSSLTVGMNERSSMTSLPSPIPANAARRIVSKQDGLYRSWTDCIDAARQIVSKQAIIGACRAGNSTQLQRWGRQGVRVRSVVPLRISVSDGTSFDILKCLVRELGADVNNRGKGGFTALSVAASEGHHDTVRCLVEELGVGVDIAHDEGCTPLYLAAMNGHLGVVRVLLKLHADINQSDQKGFTPLMMASKNEYHAVVKWLIKAGADTQAFFHNDPNATAASISRGGTSVEQTAYLEAKTHCSSPGCSGAGIKRCTGCKQVRYCGEACQLAHWTAHKADCKRWSTGQKRAAEQGK
jgi:hypothetical protein